MPAAAALAHPKGCTARPAPISPYPQQNSWTVLAAGEIYIRWGIFKQKAGGGFSGPAHSPHPARPLFALSDSAENNKRHLENASQMAPIPAALQPRGCCSMAARVPKRGQVTKGRSEAGPRPAVPFPPGLDQARTGRTGARGGENRRLHSAAAHAPSGCLRAAMLRGRSLDNRPVPIQTPKQFPGVPQTTVPVPAPTVRRAE